MTTLHYAQSEDLEAVQHIFREYQQYLGIDLCFQSFEDELKNLAQIYAQPQGCIILAKNSDNEVVGCVALKPIAPQTCEMKRLYVKPSQRGQHLGRKLVQELLYFARKANYHVMKLDTLTSLKEAIALYHSFGFVETNPYVFNPLTNVVYFELNLLPST